MRQSGFWMVMMVRDDGGWMEAIGEHGLPRIGDRDGDPRSDIRTYTNLMQPRE